MRSSPSKRLNKTPKSSTASVQAKGAQQVDGADDRGAASARLEESEYARGNTAGGRKPQYLPEYAERAKAMCERGATTDELAEAFEVSPKTIRMWQRDHGDFFDACKLTPGSIERVKRSNFESAVGQNLVTEKLIESGSQRQTVKVSVASPPNFAAAKFFVSQKEYQVEGELAQLLRQLQGSRVRPKREDGSEVSESEFPGKRRPPQHE